jgi:hypothetical protein
MQRAQTSERAALEAALTADGLAFQAGRDGQVSVNDPSHGPPPSIFIGRRAELTGDAVTVLVAIATDRSGLLALSVTETDYSPDGSRRQSQVGLSPVFRSQDGGFHVETYGGRLVGEGEFTTYFWTLAAYRLGVDE